MNEIKMTMNKQTYVYYIINPLMLTAAKGVS